MKAAVLQEFGRPLVIREFPRPPLGPRYALVKLLAAGICDSDVHMWRGRDPRTPLPTILGHEGVGQVVEVVHGAQPLLSVTGRELRSGDQIVWDRGVACGQCHQCAVKHTPHLCPNRWTYGITRPCTASPYLVGCYADHIVLLPGTNILHVDDYSFASFPLLASISCSGAIGAHAIELAQIQPGDTVLIQGAAGDMGLFLTAFARQVGAGRVITAGASTRYMELARELGADVTIDLRLTSSDERADIVRSEAGQGVDVVLESAASPESISEGISLLRTGGTCVTTGFAVPGAEVKLDHYYHIVRKHLRLQGVWGSHTRHLRQALAMLSSANPSGFEKMVTSTFTLETATDALKAVERGDVIKTAIVF